MKEFLDEINSLLLEYPEYQVEIEEILDMCLTDIESGTNKKEAINTAKEFIKVLIEEDK